MPINEHAEKENGKEELSKKMLIDEKSTGIEVVLATGEYYEDKYYVIEKSNFNGQDLFLLENETYGDEDPCVIVDGNNNVILKDVHNGFDDYREQLSDLVECYDLPFPVEFNNSDNQVTLLKQYRLPYELSFVDTDNRKYEIYQGVINSRDMHIILKSGEGNYLYSRELDSEYENGMTELANADLKSYSYQTIATENDRVKNTMVGNKPCVIDDVWCDIGTAYMIGRSINEPGIFYAKVREFNEDYMFEYDKHPTREDVEKQYKEKDSYYVLHIKYKEPVEVGGWKCDADTITFDKEAELQKYIKGNATYDYLDNSVKQTDNEMLLYAENKATGEVVWNHELMVGEEFRYCDATITKLAANDYAIDNSFGVRSAYFDTFVKAVKAINEVNEKSQSFALKKSHKI